MSVSIALCTYNGEKFIREQIESYLTQTVLPDEIIVCDDGSSDDTVSIVRQYLEANEGIKWRLIQNEKTLGTNKNFEKAVGFCSGDFIFFSDQDDIWRNEKIEQTISFFNKNRECEAIFSNAILIDENGFAPMDDTGAQLFFRLVAAAYEHRALGIASHWPFEEWGRFLPEHNTAVSLLDRLVHHGIVVVTSGESFRMKEARARGGQFSTKK